MDDEVRRWFESSAELLLLIVLRYDRLGVIDGRSSLRNSQYNILLIFFNALQANIATASYEKPVLGLGTLEVDLMLVRLNILCINRPSSYLLEPELQGRRDYNHDEWTSS